ncbi:MAG: hypothetical protein LUJ25_05515, partial [Firmicutes bacterium]|nr:hypothetical protein [Bacillota bacterium]
MALADSVPELQKWRQWTRAGNEDGAKSGWWLAILILLYIICQTMRAIRVFATATHPNRWFVELVILIVIIYQNIAHINIPVYFKANKDDTNRIDNIKQYTANYVINTHYYSSFASLRFSNSSSVENSVFAKIKW